METPTPASLSPALAWWRTVFSALSPPQLQFEQPLEGQFQCYRVERMRGLQQLSAWLSAALYLAFFVVCWVQTPQALRYLEPILLGLVPANLVYAWLLNQPLGRRHPLLASSLITVINAGALAFCSAWWHRAGLPFPSEAPVIQQFYNTLMMGLPLATAMPLAFCTILLFVFVHLGLGFPPDALVMRVFMLTAAALVGLLAAYVQEQNLRQTWVSGNQLRQMAERDGLTGLLNHRSFYELSERRMQFAAQRREPVAMLLLDLDHFKKFNDSRGHLAGDRCLAQIARIIRDTAQRPLDLVGRLGGEEFAVLLYGTAYDKAIGFAMRLREAIEQCEVLPEVRITACIGVATSEHREGQISTRTLVHEADLRLYAAKGLGRNTVC